ncbi:MAG: toll/interleukin-1 receptor domain-containing protein [Rhodospirillales bacterium]|nr:toll/interleukin-1 receptor domain-containing protein [Rhodospirillales bacterium]
MSAAINIMRGAVVTDIFLSYSSKDRERVLPIQEALHDLGFEVFWDQAVPTGVDWDAGIRQQLGKAKCAVVLWSTSSVESRNVRH